MSIHESMINIRLKYIEEDISKVVDELLNNPIDLDKIELFYLERIEKQIKQFKSVYEKKKSGEIK